MCYEQYGEVMLRVLIILLPFHLGISCTVFVLNTMLYYFVMCGFVCVCVCVWCGVG